MFSIFNRRGVKRNNEENSKQDRIATHIFITTVKFQHRWAIYLQRKTERLSKAVKIFLLIGFCLFSTTYSLYQLKHNFTKSAESFVHLDRFLKGTGTDSGNLLFKPLKHPAADDYRRIKRFLNYMDSLSLTSSGRKTKDSILSNRPGLMDSIHHLEKMYLSQSINK